jgi:hypothetical protein
VRGVSTGALVAALAALGLLGVPVAASAQGPYPGTPFAPWDGSNPFNCVLQDAGTGTTVPDPGADPFCVEFDKTQQNVTDFGIADFLANEPGRVAAASPKCFYYQSDHWTGSAVQGGAELWHWDGQYFFDKAYAVGGVNVQNFRIGGQPASPSDYGQVPPEYEPYFDQSGGGSYTIGNVPADPACLALVDTDAERAQIYVNGTPPPLPLARAAGTGAPCGNLIKGGRKRDRLDGTAGGDRLLGRRGRDRLRGANGDDCLKGGKGNDRLVAGEGNDRLRCGAGPRDVAVAEPQDFVGRSCERVRRL